MQNPPEPRTLQDGIAVYGYRIRPGAVPVAVHRLGTPPGPGFPRHIHDFPVLGVVGPDRSAEAWLIAPGAVIDPTSYLAADRAIAVFFDPRALGIDTGMWSAHPLLGPFQHGRAGGIRRIPLPPDHARRWRAALESVEIELAERDRGHAEAVAAHLTLVLIDLSRLAPAEPEPADELAREVLAVIDARYPEPLTVPDIAAAVGLSPGHLSALIRRRTARSVMDWLTERRMSAARRALAEGDDPVAEIARAVGYPDPGYFARVFRSRNGLAPRDWRRAARA